MSHDPFLSLIVKVMIGFLRNSHLSILGNFGQKSRRFPLAKSWGAYRPRLWAGLFQNIIRALSLTLIIGFGIVFLGLLLVFAGFVAVTALVIFMTLSVIALVARKPLPIKIKIRSKPNDLQARKNGSSWVTY